MTWRLFVCAAVLLSLERIAYVLIWRHPERFGAWCARSAGGGQGPPVERVRALFFVFKAIQAAVFAGWISAHGGAAPASAGLPAVAAGIALVAAGQVLNLGVFARLGTTGVFYGNRFGCDVPWCRAFPFSVLSHPQYVGTVLSIWGLFLMTRYPYSDWYLLPALETGYYWVGARLER
jgi:methylene-fatty-acyl-phospholipid synthase